VREIGYFGRNYPQQFARAARVFVDPVSRRILYWTGNAPHNPVKSPNPTGVTETLSVQNLVRMTRGLFSR
jgi:hypothetical protein